MPTVLTHAVVAGALGGAARVHRGALLAGAALAVIPDLDVYVARAAGVWEDHWLGHRGFTHSLAFAAVMALAVTLVFREPRRWSAPWWRLALFLAACGASHGLLDAMTNGGPGVMLLWPFSPDGYFFPWRPIPVSPIGRGFFSDYGLHVFLYEAAWIWLPCAALIAASLLARRVRPRG